MDLATLANYANQILTWIGFGTVVGLVSVAVVPDRDRGRNVATILMTIVGAMIACAVMKYFYYDELVMPVSSQGFLVGLAGSIAVLVFYRVLGTYWVDENAQLGYRNRILRRQRRQAFMNDRTEA